MIFIISIIISLFIIYILKKNIVNKPNTLKLFKSPKYIITIDTDITSIPQNIIDYYENNNYTLNKNNLNTINAFLISKLYFNKIFPNNCFNDLNTFTCFYKNLILNKNIEYNICLKLYNNDEYIYLYLVNNTIIKIINTNPYKYIENRLANNNVVLLVKDNKIILCYGKCIDCDFDLIIFKDFLNITSQTLLNHLEKFSNIKIFFWIAKAIN